MGRLAILAGQGALPHMIAAANPDALFVHFDGVPVDLPKLDTMPAAYERFGALFDGLQGHGVTDVVLAGGIARPSLDPSKFDAKTLELAPRFMAALQVGDDEILRAVINAFEDHGFGVKGAHDLIDTLTAEKGALSEIAPSDQDVKDAERGHVILDQLSPLDIAQGCVVASGLCLGIETVQGTDAMLHFVAGSRDRAVTALGGVLVKRPKVGQDLRVDMPAIGPDTVDGVVAAGLNGIAIAARAVVVLDRDELLARANRHGIAVWASK